MIALLLSLMVQAQEMKVPVVEGDYQVTQKYEVLSRIRWEKVPSGTEAGKQRLKELLAEGYGCPTMQGSFFNCTKNLKDLTPSESLTGVIHKKWKNAAFTFYAPFGEPDLANNTEFFKHYIVSQKVVFWEKLHESYFSVWNPISYTWTKGDIWKAQLGASTAEFYVPLIIEDKNVFIAEMYDVEKDFWVRERYFVKITLEKVSP